MERTIQRSIHPPKVHQQTNHSHTNSSRFIILQLILQDLACFATPRHSIHINIRKIHPLLPIRLPRKHLRPVLKHQLQKLVLDVLAPQRNAIFLLEVLDLVARVDGADGAIGLASCADRDVGCGGSRGGIIIIGVIIRGSRCAVGVGVWCGLVVGDFGVREGLICDGAGVDLGHFSGFFFWGCATSSKGGSLSVSNGWWLPLRVSVRLAASVSWIDGVMELKVMKSGV